MIYYVCKNPQCKSDKSIGIVKDDIHKTPVCKCCKRKMVTL